MWAARARYIRRSPYLPAGRLHTQRIVWSLGRPEATTYLNRPTGSHTPGFHYEYKCCTLLCCSSFRILNHLAAIPSIHARNSKKDKKRGTPTCSFWFSQKSLPTSGDNKSRPRHDVPPRPLPSNAIIAGSTCHNKQNSTAWCWSTT